MKRFSLKRLLALGWVSCAATTFAQLPDVNIKFNGYLNEVQEAHSSSNFVGYDTFGHYSTVGLLVTTEPGLKFYVTEKLRRIPNDGDPSQFDEAYFEGEGSWRVGKQYVPFGNGLFLHESVLAVRSDADVPILDLPLSVAGVDAGNARQRGVIVRIGGNIGASLAAGDNFGINSTDFDLIRHPEDAPGAGRGFKTIAGLDFTQKDKLFTFRGEIVRLQDGETALDQNDTAWDLSVQYQPSRNDSFTVGNTHSDNLRADIFRFQAAIRIYQNLFFEPMLRTKNGNFYDLSLGFHVKF